VTESDNDKTAFLSPFGFFQFKVMPFGLHLRILQTDASDRGVGAKLNQKNALEEENPIAYYSKNCYQEKCTIQLLRSFGNQLAIKFFRMYHIRS